MDFTVNVKHWIRVLSYTISMYVVTHILVFCLLPIGLVLVAFAPQITSRLKQSFVKMLFGIVGKTVTVTGLENLEEGKRYLIVSNYPSFYASFALINVFPEASIVAHAFISKIPLLGMFLKRIGTIFVDPKRGRISKRAIDMGLSGNSEIGSVIIFPEGQRTPDGKMHKFKRGFIYILRQSELDLLPVTLNGFYRLKPMKRIYLDPDAEPEVIIHRSISNSEASGMSDKELLETTVSIMEREYSP